MTENKIVHLVSTILSMILLPVQLVATLLQGLLAFITLNLSIIVVDVIWNIIFWPLIGLSFLWVRQPAIRILVDVIAIPYAILVNVLSPMFASFGDLAARATKMKIVGTFPYSAVTLAHLTGRRVSDEDMEMLGKIVQQSGGAEWSI